MAAPWRTEPLPPGWRALRLQVLERDGQRCVMLRRDGSRCWDRATDVDHMNGPSDHRLQSLRSLCAWHHRRVTSQQANSAQVRVTESRPRAKHPGEL